MDESTENAKKRKYSSAKTMPLPGKPHISQDPLKRPAAIVSLVMDSPASSPPVHVGAVSNDWRLAAGGCDRDVRIFSETSTLISDSLVRLEGQRLGSHSGRVLSMDFAPTNEQLLSGGQDGCIQLWNARTKALTSTYRQTDPVWCLNWTPSGPYFVSSGKDGEALLWSAERSDVLRVYGASGPAVEALRVQPDGRRVVVAHCDSFVFWDLAAAMPSSVVSCGAGMSTVTTLAFSPDGHMLAAGLEDGSFNLLDLRAIRSEKRRRHQSQHWRHRAHGQAVSTLSWSKVQNSSGHDVLFSTSGSQMLASQVTALHQIEKMEIKLGMSQVLCSSTNVGRTLLLGTQL